MQAHFIEQFWLVLTKVFCSRKSFLLLFLLLCIFIAIVHAIALISNNFQMRLHCYVVVGKNLIRFVFHSNFDLIIWVMSMREISYFCRKKKRFEMNKTDVSMILGAFRVSSQLKRCKMLDNICNATLSLYPILTVYI